MKTGNFGEDDPNQNDHAAVTMKTEFKVRLFDTNLYFALCPR